MDTVYTLRFILHDWDDEDCVRILRSVRHAIGTREASLLIIDVRVIFKEAISCLLAILPRAFQCRCQSRLICICGPKWSCGLCQRSHMPSLYMRVYAVTVSSLAKASSLPLSAANALSLR